MQARTVNPAYYFSKCKDLQGLTALHHGAGNGRIAICSFLVEEVGVDINPKSTEKGSFIVALFIFCIFILDLLLFSLFLWPESKGFCYCIRVVDNSHYSCGLNLHPGVTPLLYAASMGQLVTAKYLIVRGAEIKVRDFEGFTCLHYAAREGRVFKSIVIMLFCD